MNKILEIKFGSHLYGTNTPNSDLDFKGIYLPTAREIVLGTYKKTISTSRDKSTYERNTKDDVDTEIFSLDRYLELLMEGQTVALDMLFAPSSFYSENSTDQGIKIMQAIHNRRGLLLTRNVNAFICYAKQQAAKYGIKGSRMDSLKRVAEFLEPLPIYDKLDAHSIGIAALVVATQELVSLEKTSLIEIVMLKGPKGTFDAPHIKVNGRSIPFHANVKYAKEIVGKMLDGYGNRARKAHLNGGKDFKALSHSVRVNSEALELLSTGHITFPGPDKELLLKIKLGQLPYEQVAELIEQGLADVCAVHEKSILRDVPDRDWTNNFIFDIYSDIVKRS